MIRLIQEMRALGTMEPGHLLASAARIERPARKPLFSTAGQIVHYSMLEEERASNRRFVEIETGATTALFAMPSNTWLRLCGDRPSRIKPCFRRHRSPRYLPAAADRRTASPPQLPARSLGRHLPEAMEK